MKDAAMIRTESGPGVSFSLRPLFFCFVMYGGMLLVGRFTERPVYFVFPLASAVILIGWFCFKRQLLPTEYGLERDVLRNSLMGLRGLFHLQKYQSKVHLCQPSQSPERNSSSASPGQVTQHRGGHVDDTAPGVALQINNLHQFEKSPAQADPEARDAGLALLEFDADVRGQFKFRTIIRTHWPLTLLVLGFCFEMLCLFFEYYFYRKVILPSCNSTLTSFPPLMFPSEDRICQSLVYVLASDAFYVSFISTIVFCMGTVTIPRRSSLELHNDRLQQLYGPVWKLWCDASLHADEREAKSWRRNGLRKNWYLLGVVGAVSVFLASRLALPTSNGVQVGNNGDWLGEHHGWVVMLLALASMGTTLVASFRAIFIASQRGVARASFRMEYLTLVLDQFLRGRFNEMLETDTRIISGTGGSSVTPPEKTLGSTHAPVSANTTATSDIDPNVLGARKVDIDPKVVGARKVKALRLWLQIWLDARTVIQRYDNTFEFNQTSTVLAAMILFVIFGIPCLVYLYLTKLRHGDVGWAFYMLELGVAILCALLASLQILGRYVGVYNWSVVQERYLREELARLQAGCLIVQVNSRDKYILHNLKDLLSPSQPSMPEESSSEQTEDSKPTREEKLHGILEKFLLTCRDHNFQPTLFGYQFSENLTNAFKGYVAAAITVAISISMSTS